MKELSHYTLPELENYFQKLMMDAEKVGHSYAEKRATYEDLDSKKKPFLGSIMSSIEGPVSVREKLAYADGEYGVFNEGLSASRREYFRAQVDWELMRVRLDMVRTLISNRREEMKRIG